MKHRNPISPKKNTTPVNEDIRFPEVRTIDEDGSNLGTMPPREALSIAQEKELDLVLVSDTANPPVCRILDYGKYKYQQLKSKENNRQSSKSQLKELKMRYKIEDHDYSVRVNHAKRFLKSGNPVKATVTMRGRENLHGGLAKDLLDRMATDLEEFAQIQQSPKREGSRITMLLTPRKA
ncbi:translation initiation factor IF-3 [Lyngbya sp. PCC 8106]|uniref:translation initiation factor IF-3 n=1 Tax=Lyngbya sp. (strain PCC 8106) TaxID=313612 RepID=UPI0000EA99A3|nr:translation initiation factor IF-3 [Lyngbya sp. PCC 8106]